MPFGEVLIQFWQNPLKILYGVLVAITNFIVNLLETIIEWGMKVIGAFAEGAAQAIEAAIKAIILLLSVIFAVLAWVSMLLLFGIFYAAAFIPITITGGTIYFPSICELKMIVHYNNINADFYWKFNIEWNYIQLFEIEIPIFSLRFISQALSYESISKTSIIAQANSFEVINDISFEIWELLKKSILNNKYDNTFKIKNIHNNKYHDPFKIKNMNNNGRAMLLTLADPGPEPYIDVVYQNYNSTCNFLNNQSLDLFLQYKYPTEAEILNSLELINNSGNEFGIFTHFGHGINGSGSYGPYIDLNPPNIDPDIDPSEIIDSSDILTNFESGKGLYNLDLVFLLSCLVLKNDELANAFISRGVDIVIGGYDLVEQNLGSLFLGYFFHLLFNENLSIENAFNQSFIDLKSDILEYYSQLEAFWDYVGLIITIIGSIASAVGLAVAVMKLYAGDSLFSVILSGWTILFMVGLITLMVGISFLVGNWYYREVDYINLQFKNNLFLKIIDTDPNNDIYL
ncbi:MAG: hypothetical protein GF329_03215 [Candidatus Lokiarchaeota archaeon]|nr:hypothetical protein [Candidatus Lokiarchaeota archaeon]